MVKKIILGISGGVDSSVSAILLKEQGYDVECVFMKNWQDDDEDGYCTAAEDFKDAKAVAAKLGLKIHSINFSDAYKKNVFDHCLNEFNKGRTPNPDTLCNQEIKFKLFFEYALSLGADYVATGHYANVDHKRKQLKIAADYTKDQTYFLYTLRPEIIEQLLFPLGQLKKEDVRKIAKDHQLPNANKKDSTGICFIGERPFKAFLQSYLLPKPGEIKTLAGDIVGQHDGLMYYTIGQRSGLGIGGQVGFEQKPWFVIDKDLHQNKLIVSQDEKDLYHTGLIANQLHFISEPDSQKPISAKIRYRQQASLCQIQYLEEKQDEIEVSFTEAQRAITPGQAVVFYQDDICLGGGIIDRAIS